MSDVDFDDLSDYERDLKRFETVYLFMDYLRMMRTRTQSAVLALYPRLHDGVSVQEIEQTLDEAAYWRAVPDDWAEEYANECMDEDVHWHYGYDLWIEQEVNMLRDKGQWLPDIEDSELVFE